MTMSLDGDGAEDVNDFLRRIRELDHGRDVEDEQRSKRLEEEILKSRKERQARRAGESGGCDMIVRLKLTRLPEERGRSVSPTKTSPLYASSSLQSTGAMASTSTLRRSPSVEGPGTAHARLHGFPSDGAGRPSSGPLSLSPAHAGSPQFTSQSNRAVEPEKQTPFSRPSPRAAMAPSRASALSWQRRPEVSPSGTTEGRLLSATNQTYSASSSPKVPQHGPRGDVGEIPLADITRSLQSKDPAWFKQTEDRGTNSPAYRRNTEPLADVTYTMSKMSLPGMSREHGSPPESLRSASPSRTNSTRESVHLLRNHSTNSSISGAPSTNLGLQRREVFSPNLPAARPNGQHEELSLGPNTAMSPSQGRLAADRPERPVSPTKGLGGFVQSAMLKRSDSVQKRWSAQPKAGLSRENSVVGGSGFGGLGNGFTVLPAPSSPPSHGAYREPSSRESSRGPDPDMASHPSKHGIERGRKESDGPAVPLAMDLAPGDRPSERTAHVAHGRSQSVVEIKGEIPARVRFPELPKVTPPSSPTKPADQKRWSPLKSSWLESALNKAPESPQMKSVISQQPSWMSGITKSKQQEAAIDSSKHRSFEEVKTGGLMRAPPPGPLPHSRTPISPPDAGSDVWIREKVASSQPRSQNDHDSNRRENAPPLATNPSEALSKVPLANEASEDSVASPGSQQLSATSPPLNQSDEDRSPVAAELSQLAGSKPSPQAIKPKPPTPPKKDLRSVLKPRQTPENNAHRAEPEFRNVFGKLRPATTQKYVAPDELKDNILRGKAGLSITGGPIKSERRDDLKESILKQKEAMKAKSLGERSQSQSPSNVTTGSIRNPGSDPTEAFTGKAKLASFVANSRVGSGLSFKTPEAIERQRSIRQKPSQPTELGSDFTQRRNQASAPNVELRNKLDARLADRIMNGPPSMRTKDGDTSTSSSSLHQGPSIMHASNPEPEGMPSGSLTHMTKSRARGPKRRLPLSGEESAAASDANQS